ncbi:MAG: CdaR family protein [Myxococcota bacterium]|nr:CdaR family protein [Myxococcota bacterium]
MGKTAARSSKQQPAVTPPPDSGAVRRWIRGALFDNLLLKFLSMVLSVTVFLLVNTDKDNDITVRAPLKYEYPADKVLVSEAIPEVRVTIKGPWRRLKEFDERALGEIRLDLSNAPTGEVPITLDMVTNLPPGLTVKDINPRSVRVAFDRRVEKLVEVVPITTGRPQHGYVLAEIKSVPATVKVRGGERLLAAISTIRTSEISLEGRTDSFEQLAELAPSEGVSVDPTLRVGVNVRIEEELVTRKTQGLVIEIKGDGVDTLKWAITPPQVEVSLTGALLAVEKARSAMTPIVKLTASERTAREVQVTIEDLPPGVGVRISPERVKVTPVR